jgi:hypothetical protein
MFFLFFSLPFRGRCPQDRGVEDFFPFCSSLSVPDSSPYHGERYSSLLFSPLDEEEIAVGQSGTGGCYIPMVFLRALN